MATPEDFFAAYWLLVFAMIIGAAFLTIAVIAVIDDIRVRRMRRRYQSAKN